MDFRLTEEQQLLRSTVREFAETEIRPHVMEWDEAQQFPMDLAPEAGRARPDGHPVSRGIRRRRRCRRSTTASASRSWRASIRRSRCRWRRTMASARRTSRCSVPTSRSARYLPRLTRGEVLGAWGLTEAGAGSDAAGMRTTAAEQGMLGPQRLEDLHHPRPDRRGHGGDGRHRSHARSSRDLGLHRRARHPGHDARARKRTSSGCARAIRAK